MTVMDLKDVTADSFRPYVGHTFQFIDEESGSQVDLELYEMEENRYKAPSPEFRDPFSLFFRGPSDFYHPQGIKRLEHPDMGRLEIFLVPLQPDDKGSIFQAVFN